jgi:hypothetical protein
MDLIEEMLVEDREGFVGGMDEGEKCIGIFGLVVGVEVGDRCFWKGLGRMVYGFGFACFLVIKIDVVG